MIASLILEAASTAGLMSASAGGGSSGGGAKSPITPSENKKMIKSIIEGPKEERKFFREMLKSVAGKAGLSFSVSSMLRQSQIFTTMFGSLFQIIGAFIDIALAPLVPMMTDGLRWLVDQMPEFREKVQDWFDNKWPAIRMWFEEAYANFDNWDWWQGQLSNAWVWLKENVWEGYLKQIWNDSLEWIMREANIIARAIESWIYFDVWIPIRDWYNNSPLKTLVETLTAFWNVGEGIWWLINPFRGDMPEFWQDKFKQLGQVLKDAFLPPAAPQGVGITAPPIMEYFATTGVNQSQANRSREFKLGSDLPYRISNTQGGETYQSIADLHTDRGSRTSAIFEADLRLNSIANQAILDRHF